MRFRNSLRLLMENFKHVYRLFFAKLIISLVATALCCSFVLPGFLDFWESSEVQTLVDKGKELLGSLFSNPENVEIIKEEIFSKGGALNQVANLISSMALEISFTVAGCAIVYLLKRYAETVCHFTTGCMLNDKMSTFAESKYWATFVANLGKASVYSVVYVPLVFLFDVLILAAIWLILSIFPLFTALFVGVTAVVFMQAFKLTLTNHWMPAMSVDEKGIRSAMRLGDKVERKQRMKTFSAYLVSVYFILVVNVMVALCTFGSGLIITLPASYFFLICMQYVNYYTIKGKKYFLTFEQIERNPDRGDSEHFFAYLEDTQPNRNENK